MDNVTLQSEVPPQPADALPFTRASSVQLEDFIEAASKAVLRAVDARQATLSRERSPFLNPVITVGIWIGDRGSVLLPGEQPPGDTPTFPDRPGQ